MARRHHKPVLRRVLLADAVVSGGAGLLMVGGTSFLTPVLAVPESLLRVAGLVLLPYAAGVAYLATRPQLQRIAVWVVITSNALWALDSIVLLLTGWVAPTAFGAAVVLTQALVVASFAALQYQGLRQGAPQVS